MDVSRSNKDFMTRSHNIPSKIKLLEGRDSTAGNKIKKLKQRISASFGRLTLTKEETIPENDMEFEPSSLHGRGFLGDRMALSYTSTPSSNAFQSLNGTPDHKASSGQKNHQARLLQSLGQSLDESGSRRRDEGCHSISLEDDAPMVLQAEEMRSRSMEHGSVMDTPTNTSIFSCLPGSQSQHHLRQSSLRRAFSMLSSSSSPSKSSGYRRHHHHHQPQIINHTGTMPLYNDASAGILDASQSAIIVEFPSKAVNKAHQKHKHSSVQRHHSTSDVLAKVGPAETNASSRTTDADSKNVPIGGSSKSALLLDGESERAELARVRNGVRMRQHRPRSEGSFTGDGMRSKRVSSFGSHSPFGKPHAYEKLEQLGEGSYATVYKGISLLTNKVVALKEIRLQPEEGTPFTAIREASLLKGLKHANIVTLHDIVHTKESLTFVFEFVHTDLGQYLEKHQGGINTKNVKLFMFQLLRGLLFCHERQILHRDLKPQNLLISEIGELKLADFGLARAKSVPSRTYSNEVVTLWYRPPDVLLGSTDYSTSLDIWGVGCIFTEMITGTATFPGMKDSFDQLDHIWQVFGTANEDNWEGVTSLPNYDLTKFGIYPPKKLVNSVPKLSIIPYAESLAEGLLQLQPSKRTNAYHALYHEYFFDIPNKLYHLPDAASIFNVPCIRLAPEMDDLLRMRSNRGIPSTSSTLSGTNQKTSTFHDARSSGKSSSDKMLPLIASNKSLKSSKSLSYKASTNSKPGGPSLSFKGPSAV